MDGKLVTLNETSCDDLKHCGYTALYYRWYTYIIKRKVFCKFELTYCISMICSLTHTKLIVQFSDHVGLMFSFNLYESAFLK